MWLRGDTYRQRKVHPVHSARIHGRRDWCCALGWRQPTSGLMPSSWGVFSTIRLLRVHKFWIASNRLPYTHVVLRMHASRTAAIACPATFMTPYSMNMTKGGRVPSWKPGMAPTEVRRDSGRERTGAFSIRDPFFGAGADDWLIGDI